MILIFEYPYQIFSNIQISIRISNGSPISASIHLSFNLLIKSYPLSDVTVLSISNNLPNWYISKRVVYVFVWSSTVCPNPTALIGY